MSSRVNNWSKSFNTLLWGNSVALAWTWGIGLFFSVQVAIQFGFSALIKFATIDAVGLTLFGVINSFIAKKYNSPEDFEKAFLYKARNFKFAFLFYQFVAITLTIFCCLKYVTLPLGVLSILVAGVFIGAVIFLGEEFDITRIKYSHAVYSLLIGISFWVFVNSSLFSEGLFLSAIFDSNQNGLTATLAIDEGFVNWFKQAFSFSPLYSFGSSSAELAFWIPILVGFLCGPWLDIQHWQRAVQIKKEGLSLSASYVVGGLIFWIIMMVDGMLALACYNHGIENIPEFSLLLSNIDPGSLLYSVKKTITLVLSSDGSFHYLLGAYLVFIGLSALSTFDSGYIAYKWYLKDLLKDSKNLIFTFVNPQLVTSPISFYFFTIVTAMVSLHFSELGKFIARFDPSLEKFFRIELEYYLVFYAAFFVIYAVAFFRNIINQKSEISFSALKLFATALSSIAVFGIGYFSENSMVMALGSLVPFIYGWFSVSNSIELKPELNQVEVPKLITASSVNIQPSMNLQAVSEIPQGAQAVSLKGCYIQDGWFSHQFIPTYQDTNSVGNVYFAMYLMWVGKTRELFFNHAIPSFDPKTSSYLILTRGIEHKFQKEIKEFDEVVIQIRIADYNRKFVTLEHRIMTKDGELVGKGKQGLMFVDSKNYSLIDLPQEIQAGFLPFVEIAKSV
jgi:acyl-CoA thioesterase FadM